MTQVALLWLLELEVVLRRSGCRARHGQIRLVEATNAATGAEVEVVPTFTYTANTHPCGESHPDRTSVHAALPAVGL